MWIGKGHFEPFVLQAGLGPEIVSEQAKIEGQSKAGCHKTGHLPGAHHFRFGPHDPERRSDYGHQCKGETPHRCAAAGKLWQTICALMDMREPMPAPGQRVPGHSFDRSIKYSWPVTQCASLNNNVVRADPMHVPLKAESD